MKVFETGPSEDTHLQVNTAMQALTFLKCLVICFFLKFHFADIKLSLSLSFTQWATYSDAADECSLSRIYGGIHPPTGIDYDGSMDNEWMDG